MWSSISALSWLSIFKVKTQLTMTSQIEQDYQGPFIQHQSFGKLFFS
jgi:hypothetical protein